MAACDDQRSRGRRPVPEAVDVVIVGSGPNGLAAAIEFGRRGHFVQVFEAASTVGGGTRSAELTVPGLVHDTCSAIVPFAVASPFFRTLDLSRYGVEMVHPPAPLAHPLDDGSAAVLERSIDDTAASLGPDTKAYRKLMQRYAEHSDDIIEDLLGPFRIPRHLFVTTRFGIHAIRSVAGLVKRFETDHARALLAGIGAHAVLPLDKSPTGGIAVMLGMLGHSEGWPMVKGGTQVLADAMASHVRDLGGTIVTDRRIASMAELPNARAYMFDVTPRELAAIAGDRLPARFLRGLSRFRYGQGVFKLDAALSEPIPWKAEECRRAATVHVGGRFENLAASEAAVWQGRHADEPYVIVAQQSLFDGSRSKDGSQALWAYCHVPSGSTFDMTERIEAQIERYAPGFRDVVTARHTMTAAQMEAHNPNYIGGDINGGVQDLGQLFTRPTVRFDPYSTPDRSIYLCSSSTPPGGGVHGMGGYHAARSALRRVFS